jgi:hypothetical protein
MIDHHSRPGRVLLLLSLLWPATARPQGSPALREVVGQAIDLAGHPLPGLLLFAADAETDTLVAMRMTDRDGRVRLTLARRRHNFGILSATLGVVRLRSRGPDRFELLLGDLPGRETPGADPGAARFDSPRASIVRGRVVDESGAALPGVRLDVLRRTGSVASSILAGRGGEFALFLPGGESWVHPSAPGLRLVRTARNGANLILVMGISAELQSVTIGGRTLTFRPQESIDPEYTPPAAVRALLAFAYGICPATAPLKAHEKAALKKYWYLDVLRAAPPNPASVSTASCVSPSQYELPPGQVAVGGFELWREGALRGGPE